MYKQRINLTIDNNVYNFFRIVRPDINLSKLINDFLVQYMEVEEVSSEQFHELEEELERTNSELKEIERRRNETFLKLQQAKQKFEEERKLQEKEFEAGMVFARKYNREIIEGRL